MLPFSVVWYKDDSSTWNSLRFLESDTLLLYYALCAPFEIMKLDGTAKNINLANRSIVKKKTATPKIRTILVKIMIFLG